MTNKKKLIVLFGLIAVLLVLVLLLVNTWREISDLKKQQNKRQEMSGETQQPEVKEIPVAPMITMNATITKNLNSFDYKDDIIGSAVSVAQGIVDELVAQGVHLSDATISDISLVETGAAGLYDTVSMFKVEISITDKDGVKESYDPNYLVFYKRWNVDNNGYQLICTLDENELNDKYSSLAELYGDTYTAACMIIRDEYVRSFDPVTLDSLDDDAKTRALAYSSEYGYTLSSDEFTVDKETDGVCTYIFKTSLDENYICISYLLTEDDKWLFLYGYRA